MLELPMLIEEHFMEQINIFWSISYTELPVELSKICYMHFFKQKGISLPFLA